MNRNLFPAIRVEYAGSPSITVSVDGTNLLVDSQLPTHSSFRGRRVTLPALGVGYISHLESDSTQLQNYVFESEPVESYSQQALYHYYEVGYRGGDLQLEIYLDNSEQAQTVTIPAGPVAIDTVRVYFDKLAYGFIPHIHNTANSTYDGEVLWAKPVALPPRYYRGRRTHAEFQITYVGDVTIQWYLDGTDWGDPYVLPTVSSTTTEKQYFPTGTIGHILQYRVTNPTEGRVYVVETDQTLADLEQQAMQPQQ